ncbi:MAG: sensor histidine kinase [Micromonosporaceae bacterium]|nr:sensor histidine kinase [Micromonosporaceae bacterium]
MTGTAEGFAHPALWYRDQDEYLAGTVPYLREGLAAGEPVAVAVPTGNLAPLRDALGAEAGRVLWRDMTVDGRNPGRIIPAVLLAFANAHPGQRVRIIGEPTWPGRTSAEYPACVQHEALINAAFAGRAASILCPYDAGRLNPAWVRDTRRTHPVIWDATGHFASHQYDDPLAVAEQLNPPLAEPPPRAATIWIDLQTLSQARHFVADRATRAGLSPGRVIDAVVAVNELTVNSVRHGGGAGTLSIWIEADQLICQLSDAGHLADPLAGRIPIPPQAPTGGRGLLMVNQVCDLVRIHTAASGTTVRVYLHRS